MGQRERWGRGRDRKIEIEGERSALSGNERETERHGDAPIQSSTRRERQKRERVSEEE